MLEIGQIVGSYRIVRAIGEGGMGAVFEAMHKDIGRQAAIKVLHPDIARSEEMAARFFNEARAVNLIDHPGIVQIFEFGRLPSGAPYLVMELLKGQSLADRIRRPEVLAEGLLIRLIQQVAVSLAAAHARGIVHRDLKPDNVMIVADSLVPGGERVLNLPPNCTSSGHLVYGLARRTAIERPSSSRRFHLMLAHRVRSPSGGAAGQPVRGAWNPHQRTRGPRSSL